MAFCGILFGSSCINAFKELNCTDILK
jgi:hypothetical protein